MHFSTLAVAASFGLAAAQRPMNMSICDYYTTALLKENTPKNQYSLLTLVVNTAVIGNYTMPNVGIAVPGILAKGTYNGTAVNLLPYFDGSLKSSNRGGKAVSVNFLDDGGAAPLKMNMPSAGNMTSNQYMLLTHLYEFFGVLLGCTGVGKTDFSAYAGNTNMGAVHQFMNLNPFQMGYFITQVGLAAASFGVTQEDATAVGMALNKLFNMRCSAPAAVIPSAMPEPQAMCQNPACPLAMNATCAAYANETSPMAVNGTTVVPPGSSNSTNSSSSGGSGSSGSSGSGTKSAGSHAGISATLASLVVGVVAFTVFLS